MLELTPPSQRIIQHYAQRMPFTNPHATPKTEENAWKPSILQTIATNGTGIPHLAEEIGQHQAYLENGDGLMRKERLHLKTELENLLRTTLVSRWRESIAAEYQHTLEKLVAREISPLKAVEMLLKGKNL